jgi:glycosyltransferase involved in cell wall biosynthesis
MTKGGCSTGVPNVHHGGAFVRRKDRRRGRIGLSAVPGRDGFDGGGATSGGRRLRIGIDAHVIGDRKTGNERFMANVIPALRRICDHELFLYFTHPEAMHSWAASAGTHLRLLRPANPLIRIPFSLGYRAARDRLDVLFVQYTGPPVVSCPVVTVVHDVAFALHPEWFAPRERIWMRRTIPFTMRHAAAVVTVSGFSRDEIVEVFGVPAEKVTVAHNGVDPVFLDPAVRSSPVEPPFFLAVGNLQPRKNLAMLVRAYRRALELEPGLAERLVIVGQEWFAAEELHRETADLMAAGKVVFTGYVGDGELVGLLRSATAFIYPSVYEGFGLPPVEAMAVGTPVLVGDIPVMREVAGDAALRLPAADPEAWARAMVDLASNPGLQADLSRRGPDRAARFTWEASARAILGALERAARVRRRARHK